jgi:hypothetical protein
VEEVHIVLRHFGVQREEADAEQRGEEGVREEVREVPLGSEVAEQTAREGDDGDDRLLRVGVAEHLQQSIQQLRLHKVSASQQPYSKTPKSSSRSPFTSTLQSSLNHSPIGPPFLGSFILSILRQRCLIRKYVLGLGLHVFL